MKDIIFFLFVLILSTITALVYVNSNGFMPIDNLYREVIVTILSLFIVGCFVAIILDLGEYPNFYCLTAGTYALVNMFILS